MESTGVPSPFPAAPAGTIAGVEHDFGGSHDVTGAGPLASGVEGDTAGPGGAAAGFESAGLEGDGATAELDIDASVLDAIEEELADVERALTSLDEGTYGQCEVCGQRIDDAVLVRTPAARFCGEHLPLVAR